MADASQLLPRVILTQQADGTIVAEYYLNGSRSQETLTKGFEMIAIRDLLEAQKKTIEAAQARKEALAELAAKQLHRKVWHNTAYTHGVHFADKFVGNIKEPKLYNPSAKDKVHNPLDLL